MSDKNETRDAINRICEAYGFTSRVQLAVYLGMTASYISNKILRNSFPYDIAVQCALEKGVSLNWLISGKGNMYENTEKDIIRLPTYLLKDSILYQGDHVIYDKALLPKHDNDLAIVTDDNIKYFIEKTDKISTDDKYLIKYSDTINIKDLTILPGNKIRIDWGKYPIDCTFDDIEISGKVIATYVENK
ncbi:MAG TPA: phage repressor protein CI [Arsenophonus nasoniae]|uniref:phage repressor protein CI n=1 Tax=Arsenophonus nasoniae TaxID=638 RepID=UPI0038797339